MKTIKCRRCPKLKKLDLGKMKGHESTRAVPVCKALNNTLKVIRPDGSEFEKPTVSDVFYNRILPDINCPRVEAARAAGHIMWPDFTIFPDGSTKNWLQEVAF